MGSYTNDTDAPQVMPNVPGRGAVDVAPGETVEWDDPPPVKEVDEDLVRHREKVREEQAKRSKPEATKADKPKGDV